MCLLTVFFFAGGIREDVVGEVVILIDEEINLLTSVKACLTQIVELFNVPSSLIISSKQEEGSRLAYLLQNMENSILQCASIALL